MCGLCTIHCCSLRSKCSWCLVGVMSVIICNFAHAYSIYIRDVLFVVCSATEVHVLRHLHVVNRLFLQYSSSSILCLPVEVVRRTLRQNVIGVRPENPLVFLCWLRFETVQVLVSRRVENAQIRRTMYKPHRIYITPIHTTTVLLLELYGNDCNATYYSTP